VGVGGGGNGHLLEAYSTKPTAVAVVAVGVAAVAGRGKLKNVR